VNCWLVLTGSEAASGDKAIDTRFEAAAVTVRLALDCCVPDFAAIVTVPDVDPAAMPPGLILATLASDELHCAELVMSVELPSE
jgi:hypothetical protein